MSKQVIFIQGAGLGAHKEDEKLASSLSHSLGTEYIVHYPTMPDEDDPSYATWKHQIKTELALAQSPVVLAGHSLGGSVLVKCLSEIAVKNKIAGIFLIATPFWGGDGWLYEGYEELELAHDFAARLPKDAPLFLYQGRDDEIVPFEHLSLYARVLPQATVRELDEKDHQLNSDLSEVAEDIKGL